MAVIQKPFRCGDLYGTTMIFENVGDVFDAHLHDEETVHITVVRKGQIELFGRPAINGAVISQGDLVDWNVLELHGFRALTAGARIDNIRKFYRHADSKP